MRILSVVSGHDSSATIINDGEIELFLKEERYSGKKRDGDNQRIFDQLLLSGKLENLDYFFIQSDYKFVEYKRVIDVLRSNSPNVKIIQNLNKEHHLFHGFVSYVNSGFDKCLVVVNDSAGGYLGDVDDPTVFETDSVYIMNDNKVFKRYKRYYPMKPISEDIRKKVGQCDVEISYTKITVGNLYNTAALSMGESISDCGKAMGLASYGKPCSSLVDLMGVDGRDTIKKYFENQPELLDLLDEKLDPYESKWENNITKDNYQLYADYCYEVQKQTSNHICNLVEKYVEDTGIRKVCISGGYGMNIVNNYNLTQKFPDVEFYFEPVCDDTGLSIGASMYIYSLVTDKRCVSNKTTFYHGFDHDLSSYNGENAGVKEVASILQGNCSVGVFYGRAEAGQRALGNRSILFNPLNPDAKEIVNRIKRREWYRPFAAMVLEEDAHLYFENLCSNPSMTVCFPVKSDIIPGVTHVDGTSRVQTVDKNHFLYDLLQEFKQLTGHGILLNTSFNLAGKPLVESPQDAFKVLDESTLDCLWLFETKQLFKSTF